MWIQRLGLPRRSDLRPRLLEGFTAAISAQATVQTSRVSSGTEEEENKERRVFAFRTSPPSCTSCTQSSRVQLRNSQPAHQPFLASCRTSQSRAPTAHPHDPPPSSPHPNRLHSSFLPLHNLPRNDPLRRPSPHHERRLVRSRMGRPSAREARWSARGNGGAVLLLSVRLGFWSYPERNELMRVCAE